MPKDQVQRLRIVLSFLVTLIGLCAQAQARLEGEVKGNGGNPVPYATINLAQQHVGASSQPDGSFTLELPSANAFADTLVVQCVGYIGRRIPLVVMPGQRLHITLRQQNTELKAVEIMPQEPLPDALDLLKLARKNVKHNYTRSDLEIPGFYRELLTVDGIHSEVNEALFNLAYGPYPARRFSRRSFRDSWDAFYSVSKYTPRGPLSEFAQNWPMFTDPDDEVRILSSRSSALKAPPGGGYQSFGDPFAGPRDLVSMDNVKYELHFLDPKLKDEYTFKTVDIIPGPDGEECYVIAFKPKQEASCFGHNWSKKVEVPLYSGTIRISRSGHVITGFECRSVRWQPLTSRCDSSQFWYRPTTVGYQVEYRRTEGGWVLSDVTYLATYNFKYRDKTAHAVTWRRSMHLGNPGTVLVHPEPATAFPLVHESMRYRYNDYDSALWARCEDAYAYEPLPSKAKQELDDPVPLDVQFRDEARPIKELSPPVPRDFPCWVDAVLPNDSCISRYRELENNYSKQVVQRMVNDERGFLYDALIALERDTSSAPENASTTFYQADSTGQQWFCERDSAGLVHRLLNVSRELRSRNFPRLMDVDVRGPYLLYAVSYPPFLHQDLLVRRRSDGQLVDSVMNVDFQAAIRDSVILYTARNAAGRADRALLHFIGDAPAKDRLVLDCPDVRYEIDANTTFSQEFIILTKGSKDDNKVFALRRSDLALLPLLVGRKDHLCTIDHYPAGLFIASDQAPDGSTRLVSFTAAGKATEKTLYTTDREVLDFYLFGNTLAVITYRAFTMQLELVDLEHPGKAKVVDTGSPLQNLQFEKPSREDPSDLLVITDAPGVPPAFYQLDWAKGTLVLKQRQQLNFLAQKDAIVTEVMEARTTDGVKVPILVSYNKTAVKDSTAAMLVQTYGAYRSIPSATFDKADYAYMKRGFILAQVGVRGSAVLGRQWYVAGKELNKKNSITDLIAAVEFLKGAFHLPSTKVFAKGVSAGGLTIAAAMNERPELFRGVLLDRPFLDVYGSMMDSTRFLTTTEYDEWGNPNASEYGEYIRSYSPAQNVHEAPYPAVFLRGSSLDQRTPDADILKFATDLRRLSNSGNLILCNSRMGQGHEVRYNMKEIADEYAFMRYCLEEQ